MNEWANGRMVALICCVLLGERIHLPGENPRKSGKIRGKAPYVERYLAMA